MRFRVFDAGTLIERQEAPRQEWSEAAELMRERGETGLLDEPTSTEFEETDWKWDCAPLVVERSTLSRWIRHEGARFGRHARA